MHKLSLFIFRRDLRLEDNLGLIAALKNSERVIPVFIFDPRQIKDNSYASQNLIRFMLESLEDLNLQLKQKSAQLFYFYDQAENAVEKLLKNYPIDAVYFNRDHTPFSIARDQAITKICQSLNRQVHFFADALLNEPELVHKDDHTPYTIFTPFMKRARKIAVQKVKVNNFTNYYNDKIAESFNHIPKEIQIEANSAIKLKGGRKVSQEILSRIAQFKNYQEERNFPALAATTGLAPHNKFGTSSIREVYWSIANVFSPEHTLINELYWRDFFTHIAFHFPRVFKGAFDQRLNKIQWQNNLQLFESWCQGKTGFPIVDAGMRELNTTGFMHNRVRMIVASFLTKDLHISWRWGEKYFATKLIDYDPAVNNGNWQWAASTGCDAQPYFRIFNPWLQQEKFDADCIYIKTWIPELKNLSSKTIHNLYKNQKKQQDLFNTDYPSPIVEHSLESEWSKNHYKSILNAR